MHPFFFTYMFCILTSITYFTIRFFCYTDLCEMLDIFQECGKLLSETYKLLSVFKSRKSLAVGG